MRYLLDTSVISAYFRAPPGDELVTKLAAHAGEMAISVTVWHELRYGWAILPASRRKSALGTFIEAVVARNFRVLDYDQRAADWHAAERASLRARGVASAYADGQVAAVAMVNGLTVVTDNVKDFVIYDSLTVEHWSGSGTVPP